jgi:hypothetical protein
MNARTMAFAAAGFWLVLSLAPLRMALERDMAVQMAIQMPLLIALGVVLAGWVLRATLAR